MTSKQKSAFSVYSEDKSNLKNVETKYGKVAQENGKKKDSNLAGKQKQQKENYKPRVSNQNGGLGGPKPFHSTTDKGQQLAALSSKLGGGVTKKNNSNKKIKKEKKKFSKLSSDHLKESIVMFNGARGANSMKGMPEFKVLNSTTKYDHQNPAGAKQPSGKYNKLVGAAKQPNPNATANCKPFTKSAKKQVEKKSQSKKMPIVNESDEDESTEQDVIFFDSRQQAAKLLRKMIAPVKNKDFFNNYWEKKPLLIKRDSKNFYDGWFSCKELDFILRNHNLEFTTNVDITTYVNGVKQKHNLEGRAFAPLVWDFFQQGCSVRLLNPASYSRNVWKYLSILQELFGSCVGANIYLTPAGTQGFAPHYDDIEAFVLQLEGRKRWRVYNPFKNDKLPRFSSENFAQSQLEQPLIDVILEPGDMLYFPRGYIHQANACDDIHSLHITVSTYQKQTWGDFLSKLLPEAVEIAMQESVKFRRGLPINSLVNNGIAFSDNEKSKDRIEFRNKTVSLIEELVKYLPIDEAVDQIAKRFIHESLPPCLTEFEKAHSIHGHGETWNSKKNRVQNISEIEPDTSVKLIRRNCVRLLVEENMCRVYHNLDNSKIFCEKEPQYLEVEADSAPAIEFLIKSYPNYIRVEDLPMNNIEEKIVVAQCLYDKGLLITGEPLSCDFEDTAQTSEDDEAGVGYDDNDDDENADDVDDDFNSVDYDNFNDDNKNNEKGEDMDDESNDEADDSDNDDDEEATEVSSKMVSSHGQGNNDEEEDDNDDDDDDDKTIESSSASNDNQINQNEEDSDQDDDDDQNEDDDDDNDDDDDDDDDDTDGNNDEE